MPVNSFENYPMTWKPSFKDCHISKYRYLANQLEKDIASGILKPGTKLPPQRELADYLDINLSTVTRAFKICEQKGLICASVGNGTYVSADASAETVLLTESEGRYIKMDAIIPTVTCYKDVSDCMQKLLREPGSENLFSYCEPHKNTGHLQTAVFWLTKTGLKTDPEHILIAAGGQNALMAALSSVCKSGDRLGTDPCTYPGLKSVAKLLGIHLIPIQTADGEMTQEGIEYAVKNEKIKGLYVIPDYHNPTSHTMSDRTRKMIAGMAKQYGLWVIEDGINTFLQEELKKPIAGYAPEHTIYLASVSKILSAGLRIAYMHVPLVKKDEIFYVLYASNIMVSPLSAELVSRMIQDGQAEEIIFKRKEEIRKRNDRMNQVFQGYPLDGDRNSPIRFLHLPEYFTGRSFEICAREAGVQIFGTERFVVGNSSTINAIRISVTTPKSMEELETGAKRLLWLLQDREETGEVLL